MAFAHIPYNCGERGFMPCIDVQMIHVHGRIDDGNKRRDTEVVSCVAQSHYSSSLPNETAGTVRLEDAAAGR